MKQFDRLYLWGANIHYHTALYTIAALLVKTIAILTKDTSPVKILTIVDSFFTNLIHGNAAIDILTIVQMLFVSLAFAFVESALFPQGKEWGVTGWRVAVWGVTANVLYLGAAFFFGWFEGVPLWCGGMLIFILECGLFAMWYALWLENKQDNQCLNCSLIEFQRS